VVHISLKARQDILFQGQPYELWIKFLNVRGIWWVCVHTFPPPLKIVSPFFNSRIHPGFWLWHHNSWPLKFKTGESFLFSKRKSDVNKFYTLILLPVITLSICGSEFVPWKLKEINGIFLSISTGIKVLVEITIQVPVHNHVFKKYLKLSPKGPLE
jgi:hypothetical protein